MKAVYIREFGGAEDLEVRDIPDPPAPAGSQVLVRVRAAGLNRADVMQRRGTYPPPAGFSPNIPGLEFAGEIIATGDSVDTFGIGDRVFGITGGEAQAEMLVIDQSLLAPIPASLDYETAAAYPEACITAHDAIVTQAELAAGETLLIHAVGSGVGLAALQIAKARGCKVLGTSRTADKLERASDFGLDHGIAIENAPPVFAQEVKNLTNGRGADVILDLVGAAYFPENLAALAVKGRIMLVGLTAGAKSEFNMSLALAKRARITGTVLRGRSVEEKAQAVSLFARDVLPLIAEGKLAANLDKVFPLDEVRAAHEYMESNAGFGKIVLSL